MAVVVPDQAVEEPFSLWREDLITALLSTTMIFGLFLDGWDHINLQNGALGSFFTPWHAVLYAGFGATAMWVMTRNPHLYLTESVPKPEFYPLLGVPLRYPFAIVGIAIATFGLIGDVIWHTVFGSETGVARVIAPFHLFLFTGAGLLIAAPLRIITTNLVLLAPILLALRRWRLPFCSVTLLSTSVAVMMTGLAEYRLGWTILAAAAGGLTADLLIRKLDPSPTRPGAVRIIAIVTPLAFWLVYFAVIIGIYDLHWPTDPWLGTLGLAGFTGARLSFLSVPPAVGGAVWADEPAARP